MKAYRWTLTLLCALALLLCPAVRAEGTETPEFSQLSLDEVMEEFMASHGLNEDNCAIGWCDLATGETWYFNEDRYMVAGSMYKLPLNMAIADRLASGELSPKDVTEGYVIENAVRLSIVNSDNDAAQALRYALSYNRDTYREILASYSGIPTQELPEVYYTENQMSPRFLINTLQHLYDHGQDYQEMLEYLKQACPGRYFQSTQTDYEIAHKYGSFNGCLNDCGIVYTPRPFALTALFRGGAAREENLGDLCALMTEYALYLDSLASAEPEPEPSPEPEAAGSAATPESAPTPVPAPVPTPAPMPAETVPAADDSSAAGPMSTGAVIVAAAIVLALALILTWRGCGRWAAVLVVAVLLVSNMVWLTRRQEETVRELTPAPAPAGTPAAMSAPEPAAAVPEPEETPVPTETPVPEQTVWTLSFAGDCTIGTVHEWQGYQSSSNMLYVMGGDYGYPFSKVAELFEQDDFTMVNLEGALTDETRSKSKDYRFRSGPENAEVLARGNVDAVSLANNHSGDYLAAGLEETKTALDDTGVLWADESVPIITELQGGLKLGVVSFNCVEIDLDVGDVEGYMERIVPLYEQCAAANCDVIAAYIHWGWEYRYAPETWMVTLAHELADLGCDIVIGSHAHVLQKTELYNGVPVFYSLGNFCYGGHHNPDDKDTVIVQQDILWADGEVSLGETRYIPCCISSTDSLNDFRPAPYEESDEGYDRVLKKLELDGNGTA